MAGGSWIRRLMPREERFHEMFGRDTANLLATARLFNEVAASESLESRKVKLNELKRLEHEGDQITRQIIEGLASTFITPLEREDIHALTNTLDDIVDYFESVGQTLVLFELSASPEALRQFANLLVLMAEQVDTAIRLIWDLKNENEIRRAMMQLGELENRGDALYQTVVAALFKGEGSEVTGLAVGAARDPIELLKWKEIYDELENACDRCKDVAHIVGDILLKGL